MWSPWAWVSAMRTIGAPERRGGREDRLGGARDHRVDQRQPVVLLDEVALTKPKRVILWTGIAGKLLS